MILYLKQVDYELDKKLNDYDILIDNEMIWPLALKFKYKTVLTDTQFLFKAIKCIWINYFNFKSHLKLIIHN